MAPILHFVRAHSQTPTLLRPPYVHRYRQRYSVHTTHPQFILKSKPVSAMQVFHVMRKFNVSLTNFQTINTFKEPMRMASRPPMSPFLRPCSREVQSYSRTVNALDRDRQIVIVELKVVLARSLARAPVGGLHKLIALLVQLVETRQLLQVRGVVERPEEHREAFLLVRLDDLDARQEIAFRIRKNNPNTIGIRRKEKKNNNNKNIIQMDVPSRCTRCTYRIVGL